MKSLFVHDSVEIQYNKEMNGIEVIWKAHQDPETFRLAYNQVSGFIKEYSATNFLADIRNEGIVGPETSQWLRDVIMPQGFANGLEKIAVVMDADIFKKYYVITVSKGAIGRQMEYFETIEAAYSWLKEN